MGTVAVIGEAIRARGFGLAGALVYEAGDPAAVIKAWDQLPAEVVLVVLTPSAASALDASPTTRRALSTVVMPP